MSFMNKGRGDVVPKLTNNKLFFVTAIIIINTCLDLSVQRLYISTYRFFSGITLAIANMASLQVGKSRFCSSERRKLLSLSRGARRFSLAPRDYCGVDSNTWEWVWTCIAYYNYYYVMCIIDLVSVPEPMLTSFMTPSGI